MAMDELNFFPVKAVKPDLFQFWIAGNTQGNASDILEDSEIPSNKGNVLLDCINICYNYFFVCFSSPSICMYIIVCLHYYTFAIIHFNEGDML